MKKYSGLGILLHWLVAIMIVGAFAVGWYMTDLKISPTKLKLYSWHKWAGVTIFAFVILRLAVKIIKGTPSYPDSMPNWEKQVAKITHLALYALMFAVPISGYFYTCAAGFPVVYFGVLPLPTVMAADPSWKEPLKELHEALTTGLLTLVVLHFAAAMKHQFIDKDGILQRMLPTSNKQEP